MDKDAKRVERYFKGAANHWRIAIIELVARSPGITVEEIATHLEANFKTISEHTRKLSLAGLVDKKYRGKFVTHKLSPYGHRFRTFIDTFLHSG